MNAASLMLRDDGKQFSFRSMMDLSARILRAVLLAASAFILVGTAAAQEAPPSPPGFLDNLFGGGSSQRQQPVATPAQSSSTDLAVRLDRLEAHIRQLTGTIEQLQFRNQQLEQQLQRLQGGAAAASSANPPPRSGAQTSPVPPGPPPVIPAVPGRRSDVFDPAQNPNAPGVPQTLGSVPATPDPGMQTPIGAPGGRAAGAPLDLSMPSGAAGTDPSQPGDQSLLPPPRNPSATGAQVATLPPSQTPRDEFALAVGYVKRKDYALAEDGFRAFLKKYPSDAMVADAHYWLGESLYQRQRYQDAAKSFLTVTTNHSSNAKAPEALLRLGQSLAALGEKETACATWGEVGRKYAKAPANVKSTVAAEQKRARC